MKNLVILIEDTDVDALIAQKMFDKALPGLEFMHFKEASKALTYLKNEKSLPPKTLLIVDLMMPVIDGFQFLEKYEVEVYPKAKHCKVIVLTSSVDNRDRKKLKHLKCIHDFWVKPLTIEMAKKAGKMLK